MTSNAPGAQADTDPQDLEEDDNISGYESDMSRTGGSYTTSVASTIYQFRKEHGRTYHAYKDGQYAFPNDEPELDRLDLQHCIFLMSLDGKLHLAPIVPQPQNVLDVGTGTGLWAMDFADAHPSAQVIGVDLSPSQQDFVPPNLQFQIDDVNDEWTYSERFDLIFCRQLHFAVGEQKLMRQAFNFVRPGGWLEWQEVCAPAFSDDGTLKPDSALSKWYNLLNEACRKLGQDPTNPRRYGEWMKEAGFVNVQEKIVKWPLSPWPKDKRSKTLGQWNMWNALQGMEGFCMALLTRVLNWSVEEVQLFLVEVRKDIKNPMIHAYMPVYFVYGQKPSGN